MLAKIINFIKRDIWRIRTRHLPASKSFLIKQLRITILALRDFNKDNCQYKASALTFYTLLAIVPVFAMAFGIAKGFGFDKTLQAQLLEKLPGQEEILRKVIDFAYSLLENTQGGMIAGIGIVLLFWLVIKVLGSIEHSFNDIWGIKKSRHLGRKFTDYLSIMLIGPILLIMSSSITVMITTQIQIITQKVTLLGTLSPYIFTSLKSLTYFFVWVLFAFIYIFIPNSKVKFSSGIIAGIIAGTIYQVVQGLYITFQVGVAKYNAIYGSFAALPLFLVWLRISWLIVLFGAEISFAHQNVDTYEFEPDCLKISHSFKKLLSLRIIHLLVKNFQTGEKPLAANDISHKLEIPVRLVNTILFEAVEAGILAEVQDGKQGSCFQPAKDINTLSLNNIIKALEEHGSKDLPIDHSEELAKLDESLNAFSQELEKSPTNILLKDI